MQMLITSVCIRVFIGIAHMIFKKMNKNANIFIFSWKFKQNLWYSSNLFKPAVFLWIWIQTIQVLREPPNKTTNGPPCPSKCVISQQFCVYMYIRLWQYLHGGVLHGNFAIHPMLSQHIDFDFPRRQISIDMRSLKLKLSRFYTE